MIETRELRDAVQKAFPADVLSPPRDESWELAAEMGWLMVELAEEQGGLGLGREASAAVHFELGKVLPRVPLAVALSALQGIAASTQLANRDEWIERICGGEYVPLNWLHSAVEEADDGTLSGTVPGVFEADMADHALVLAAGSYRIIPLGADGVSLRERKIWDPSRRLFEIVLDGYAPDPDLLVASGDEVSALQKAIAPSVQLALAADSLGAANAALDMTVDYLKTRRQFDRPLALFQALKHRVAELKVRLEAAEALFWDRADEASTMLQIGALKAHCNTLFRDVAEEAVQLHGGIGLTEEHPCHLFLKRAMLNCTLNGDAAHWERAAGAALLADS